MGKPIRIPESDRRRRIHLVSRKPTIAVVCTLLCLFFLFFSTPAIGATNSSFPSSFYVTFQGHRTSDLNPDGTIPTLLVQFLNGTTCYPETVCFTFSMDESPAGEYIVKFVLLFDNFHDEISLPAAVSDGRVYIDSIPTIFVVNPASLTEGNTIQLYKTENLTLTGTVAMDGRPTTLINNYRVVSKVVQTSYQQDDSSDPFLILSPHLFFDPKTGVLTFGAVQLRDVLLNKLGINFIIDGIYELTDYSDNLNFTLVRTTSPSLVLILIPVVSVIAFVLVVIFTYRSLKKKREKRKTYSNKTLKFHFIRYQNMRCSYGL